MHKNFSELTEEEAMPVATSCQQQTKKGKSRESSPFFSFNVLLKTFLVHLTWDSFL